MRRIARGMGAALLMGVAAIAGCDFPPTTDEPPPSGSVLWARVLDGEALAPLPDGRFAEAGWLVGERTFGEGQAGETTLEVPSGDRGLFVAVYGSEGQLQRAAIYARGVEACEDASLELNATARDDGSLILLLGYPCAVTFPAETAGDDLPAGFGTLLASFDADGRLEWAEREGVGEEAWEGLSYPAVRTLTGGAIGILGTLCGSAVFGAGAPNETALDGDAALTETAAVRIERDGALGFALKLDGIIAAFDATADGAFICAGRDADGYIVIKVDSYGEFVWSQPVTGAECGANSFYNRGGLEAREDGSFVLVGQATDGICVARYDADGLLLEAPITVRLDVTDGTIVPAGAALLPDDHLVFAVTFSPRATVETPLASEEVVAPGDTDEECLDTDPPDCYTVYPTNALLVHLDDSGELVWAKNAGGALDDYSVSVVALTDGTALWRGLFMQAIYFAGSDPDAGFTVNAQDGPQDAFLAAVVP